MFATEEQFSAAKALRLGFEKYSRDAGYCWCVVGGIELLCLLSALMISFHLVVIAQLLFQLESPPPDSYLTAFLVCYIIARTAAQPLISLWALNFAEGNKLSVDELLGFDVAKHLPAFFKNASGGFAAAACIAAGSTILIIPGIIVASSLRFYKFLVLEDDQGAIAALRGSYELSGGHLAQLVSFQLLSFLIKVGGLLLFGIGVVPALAVCRLAEASAYEELKASRDRH